MEHVLIEAIHLLLDAVGHHGRTFCFGGLALALLPLLA